MEEKTGKMRPRNTSLPELVSLLWLLGHHLPLIMERKVNWVTVILAAMGGQKDNLLRKMPKYRISYESPGDFLFCF